MVITTSLLFNKFLSCSLNSPEQVIHDPVPDGIEKVNATSGDAHLKPDGHLGTGKKKMQENLSNQ